MSVIAKMSIREVTDFGTGSFALLGCVADNDLMAAYATSEEDKLFSRYSPWGEIRLHQRSGWAVFVKTEEHVEGPSPYKCFYAVLLPAEEADLSAPQFPNASAFIKVNCYSKSKFAQDGSRVELREVYGLKPNEERGSRGNVIEKLSWKMHVDNPPAENQFVPGQDYWLVFYDADKFTRDTSIAAAHA